MKKLFLLSLPILLLIIPVVAQQPQPNPQATAPRSLAPSDADQLALVRLRAQILDAQTRMKAAQDAFEKAQKDMQDAQAKFTPLLEGAKNKLPPPAKGKMWQAQDDGQMGVIYVEVDVPQPKKDGDK